MTDFEALIERAKRDGEARGPAVVVGALNIRTGAVFAPGRQSNFPARAGKSRPSDTENDSVGGESEHLPTTAGES